jgi:hypothetical protein
MAGFEVTTEETGLFVFSDLASALNLDGGANRASYAR